MNLDRINTSEVLQALEEMDKIIDSSTSTELERDLAEALKHSLYYINRIGESKNDYKM